MNCNAVEQIIVDWLKDYLKKSNQEGFVVGISGGVDSALVSTLCALTKYPTLLLSLPIHQSADQIKRARDHMTWLVGQAAAGQKDNVALAEVDLTEPFTTLKHHLRGEVQEDELAMANTRSRLRMTILYAYAGHNGYLVAGTGNRVEDFGIGFCTKFGDSAVDISPIGDLSKTQVWELAKYVGVSAEIIMAVPTDGLWADNRGDEAQIGASYAELEWAMGICETKNYSDPLFYPSTTGIKFTPRQEIVLQIYLQRHASSRHKFSPIPVCAIPKIIL